MIKQLSNAVLTCIQGTCGLVEMARVDGSTETVIFWCRFCGKLEVYENTWEDGEIIYSNRVTSLEPKSMQILRSKLSEDRT